MVVATGFFDGVHTGHRLVIRQLVEAAAVRGDESMVVTFWPHPRNVLQKEARSLRLLTTLAEKKQMLHDLGAMSHIKSRIQNYYTQVWEAELMNIVIQKYKAFL